MAAVRVYCTQNTSSGFKVQTGGEKEKATESDSKAKAIEWNWVACGVHVANGLFRLLAPKVKCCESYLFNCRLRAL